MIILSSLVFAGQIFKYNGDTIVGCYKKSDAFLALVVSVSSPNEFTKEYKDKDKCYYINSTTGVTFKVLKKEEVPFRKGSVMYYYLKVLNNKGEETNLDLWFADLMKNIQKQL